MCLKLILEKTRVKQTWFKKILFYKIRCRPEIFSRPHERRHILKKLSRKKTKQQHLKNLEHDNVPGPPPPHSVFLCPVSDHTWGAGPTSWRRWPSWRRSLWFWSPAGRLWPRPPVCRSQTPRRRCRVSPGPDGPLWNQETCAGQKKSRLHISSL